MKKKLLALLLTSTMMFHLAACGSSDTHSIEESSDNTTVEETEEDASSSIIYDEEILLDISEVILLDDEYAKVTISDGTFQETQEGDRYSFAITLENKMSDTTLDLGLGAVTINGISGIDINGHDGSYPVGPEEYQMEMNDGKKIDWPMNVAPGESMSGSFYFTIPTYLTPYIEKATIISSYIYIIDVPEDIDVLFADVPLITDTSFELYPFGENAAEAFSYTTKDSDIVIMDNDQAYIAIISAKFPENEYEAFEGILYIENKYNETFYCWSKNTSVNGIFFDKELLDRWMDPGMKSFNHLYISSNLFSNYGIPYDEIQSIDFDLTVQEYTYEALVLFEGNISIEP